MLPRRTGTMGHRSRRFVSALLVLEAMYWFGAHDWSKYDGEPKQRWARQLGQMANVLMGLLALPVSRNSIWSEVLGVPWEVSISLHRLLGYAFLAVGLAHMGCWWAVYAVVGTFPHDIYSTPTYWPLDGMPINPLGSDE